MSPEVADCSDVSDVSLQELIDRCLTDMDSQETILQTPPAREQEAQDPNKPDWWAWMIGESYGNEDQLVERIMNGEESQQDGQHLPTTQEQQINKDIEQLLREGLEDLDDSDFN